MVHEEGRVANESNVYHYDFYIKDHLGNVRQVLRQPKTETKLATMESQHVLKEQEDFFGLTASRQTDVEQNVTPGGDKVAWLNAARGRVLGPSSRQEVFTGDQLNLSVYGKYEEQPLQKTNPAGFVNSGGKSKILDDLNELSKSTQQAGVANPISILNMIGIVATDLQQKETPEAYLLYALYDSDGNRYEVGKQPLSRKAANQHEILEEKLYISQDGHMETVLVNETAEDVWFDDFSISRTPSIVIQETHYDPWGLELTGLGYQNGKVKENKYLYNGKELIEENDLQYYDYGARMYDPVIGRWGVVDPMAEIYQAFSPYNYTLNNSIKFIDPNGMWVENADSFSTDDPDEIREFFTSRQRSFEGNCCPEDNNKLDQNRRAGTPQNGWSVVRSNTLVESASNGGTYADYGSSFLGFVQVGILEYRKSLSISSKVGTFGRFSRVYSGIGVGSRILGRLTYALAPFSVLSDYREMQRGEIGEARFTYRTVGITSSIVGGAATGSAFGGPWGALGGTLIGGTFVAGEITYDAGVWLWNETNRQKYNFKKALNNRWYPGR